MLVRRHLDYRACTECGWQFTPLTADATLCPLCDTDIERAKRARQAEVIRGYRPCGRCGTPFLPAPGRAGYNQRYCKDEVCSADRKREAYEKWYQEKCNKAAMMQAAEKRG